MKHIKDRFLKIITGPILVITGNIFISFMLSIFKGPIILRMILFILASTSLAYYLFNRIEFKRLNIWFLCFAFIVCLYNALGYDDKNIILYTLNPTFWIWEELRVFLAGNYILLYEKYFDFNVRYGAKVLYLSSLIFWFLWGWFIDWVNIKIKS